MWNTMPVAGVLVSMIGGGTFFTLFVLTQQYGATTQHLLPLRSGLSFWPALVGVLISATLFGPIVRTRLLPAFALGGMLCLIVAAILLLNSATLQVTALEELGYGVLGLGAGATVAPGLWMASLSLESKMVGRIFALVELVRSEANFLMAPIILKIAQGASGGSGAVSTTGFHLGIWITLGLTVTLTVLGVVIYLAGGAGMQRPDLRVWLKENRPAWASPELFAIARGVHPKQQTQRRAS